MIEQKLKHPGLLPEQLDDSIFLVDPDLVLVFFPTPGVFVKDSLKLPENYLCHPVTFYYEDAEPFDNMYVFLPAVIPSQYESGMNQSGITYERGVLKFEPDLIEMLAEQNPEVIEHRS